LTMATKIEPTVGKGVHIKYKGMLDFPELWRLIIDWFDSKGFEVMEGKAKHKAGTFGHEVEGEIAAWRNITDYYRFEMSVSMKYWDANPVEVVRGDQKKTLLKGRFMFRLRGSLVLDWGGRYERTKFRQVLGKFLNNKVLMWQWDSIYGDQLNYKVLELGNVIKEYLNMEGSGSEYADMW
jgi:hypothetical protein